MDRLRGVDRLTASIDFHGAGPLKNPTEIKRREFLRNVGAASTTGAVHTHASSAQAEEDSSPTAGEASRDDTQIDRVTISIRINGRPRELTIDSRTTLVDLLRENLGLFGTKKGCDHGSCGACTVHIDGKRILSCLTLAATIDGADVRTIEGLAGEDSLHPMQEAFLRCDAYQCGYCTPGQIMSGVACIDEGHASGPAEETREWMSGNLCRCSAYPNILAAVRQTAGSESVKDPTDATLEASR